MNITLKSLPYQPDSQAHCPTCKKLVWCHMLEYVRLGNRHDLTLWHKECNTEWKYEI